MTEYAVPKMKLGPDVIGQEKWSDHNMWPLDTDWVTHGS